MTSTTFFTPDCTIYFPSDWTMLQVLTWVNTNIPPTAAVYPWVMNAAHGQWSIGVKY